MRNVSFGKLPVSQAILLDFVFYLKKTFLPSWRDLDYTLICFSGHMRGWGVAKLLGITEWRPKKAAESTSRSELPHALVMAEKMELGKAQPGLWGWYSVWSKSQGWFHPVTSIYSLNKQIQCRPDSRQRCTGEQTPSSPQSHGVYIPEEGK